ncbi:unnamed protein product [Lepeophtheirus salmonis]|uniref:(salmon louse) hypothetical protein n=1 Tax=Lepeophtheirus salmonis TaxID=72036 RepID=A0A7R8H595_LEPSM|nr:unnamed protein product [Lepeophtheirus salmonis]CAF2864227.1 unnamed protein product [Lepeophtheirus salmonis]
MSSPNNNITFNATVGFVCHESFDSVRTLKAHAKERHIEEYNAFKMGLYSSVGSAIPDSLVEKLAEARIMRSMDVCRGRAREMNNLLIYLHGDISHADLVRVRHRTFYKKRVSEVMGDLEATASNSGTRLIGDISMSFVEQEAEVLSQDPALSSSEITDMLLTTNNDMTREQIPIIRSSPTYMDMVVNPSGSPSRVVKTSANSSVFVPDAEEAYPNVFETPLREADVVSLSQATGAVFETIVLDDPEDAEVVEGPMNIVTSPTPAGPLQNYSAAVTSFPTPNPVPQSPTPRVESLDLLERIRFIKNMMITVQDTGESPSGVGEKTHKRHHANPTQMISSGVDLDSLIPELLDVVAASMASGDKKKEKVSDGQPHPTNVVEQVGPYKSERLLVSFTLKHQKVLLKENDSPLSQKTCLKLIVLFEEFAEELHLLKTPKESEEFTGVQVRLQVERRYSVYIFVSPIKKLASEGEQHQKRSGKSSSQKKGASDRDSFYSRKALEQTLQKDLGWAEIFSTSSKADDRSPTPVGRVLYELQKVITVDEVKNCPPSAGAGKDPLVLPHVTWVLHKIFANRLKQVPFDECEKDFREVKGCSENSLILNTIIKMATKNNKKRWVAIAFADFSMAFDRLL